MKGRRPRTKPIEQEIEEQMPHTVVLRPYDPCFKGDGDGKHCYHLVAEYNYAQQEVCCRCGKSKWLTYGREQGHGPYVENIRLPDSPYFSSSFCSTSSVWGVPGRTSERLVPRPDPDRVGPGVVDSSVAKWLR